MDTRGVSLARNKRSGSRLVCVAPRLSANSTWQWRGDNAIFAPTAWKA